MDNPKICEDCEREVAELVEHDGDMVCKPCKNEDITRQQDEYEIFGTFHK